MKEPSSKVKFALFTLSANQCAFPGCDAPLFEEGSIVGDVCHINGQRPGSARYTEGLSDEELHGIANLVLLCKKHHKIVDDDEGKYNADWLRRKKAEHEARATITPTTVLHWLIDALAPEVPEKWWERPGAPVFQFNLDSTRRDEWIFRVGVRQIDGGDIGKLRYRYRHGDLEYDIRDADLRKQRRWRLENLFVRTARASA